MVKWILFFVLVHFIGCVINNSNKGNGIYHLGSRNIRKTSELAQNYLITDIFGEDIEKIKPWTFAHKGKFPCILYSIYFNIITQSQIYEFPPEIKSIAIFKGYIAYLSTDAIRIAVIASNNLTRVHYHSTGKKYNFIKEVSFSSGEDFILFAEANKTSFAKFNLDGFTMGKIKLLFDFGIKRDTKVEIYDNYAFIPGGDFGLHVVEFERTSSELIYRGNLLNGTKIVDAALLPIESNTPKLLLAYYPKHLILAKINLKDFTIETEKLNVDAPFGIACYQTKKGTKDINCLVLIEDKIGYRELFELNIPNENFTNFELNMRHSSHDMLYLRVVNSTALAFGQSSYLILKKGWSKYIQASNDYKKSAVYLYIVDNVRLIEVHEKYLILSMVAEDYGNFYCSENIKPGTYDFSLSGISSRCIEEGEAIEKGVNCTYTVDVKFEVEITNTKGGEMFWVVGAVCVLLIFACAVFIYRRRRKYRLIEEITAGRSTGKMNGIGKDAEL